MSEDNGKYTASTGDKINVDYDVPPNTEQARTLCATILDEVADLKSFVLMQSGGHIRKQLFELPEQIKTQSLKFAELTNHIKTLRASLAITRNDALELVLSATETDMGKTKQKYSNDKARDLATKQLLRDDKLYLDNVDELSRKECEMRKEQIQLEYLNNQFRAYLAIAGMQGVKS